MDLTLGDPGVHSLGLGGCAAAGASAGDDGAGSPDQSGNKLNVLVGREAEEAALAAALGSATRGQGRLVVVEGAAGMGKSALLRSTLESASNSGVTTLRGRGSQLESEFPFGLALQLLEPAVSSADTEAVFAGAAALARPLLTPDQAVLSLPQEDRGFTLLHGLYWVVA